MDLIYDAIRKRAQQIVRHSPSPDFYTDFSKENDISRRMFEADPLIRRLWHFVEDRLEDDFGHGLNHAAKVTLDAGALMIIEAEKAGWAPNKVFRRALVTQCAGVLHDFRRKQENHAEKGADYARQILRAYPLTAGEIEDISQAIRNHEAFQEPAAVNTAEGALVSDCLYDADKFRWGPDNFTDTVWRMVSYSRTPLNAFIRRYPGGMAKIEKIKATFRSDTGRKYGPQFIDIGLQIGAELYRVIETEFGHLIDASPD